MEECQQVNKSFLSRSADQSQLLNDHVVLITGFTRRIFVPAYNDDFFTVDVRKYKSPKIYLGHEVDVYKRQNQYRSR